MSHALARSGVVVFDTIQLLMCAPRTGTAAPTLFAMVRKSAAASRRRSRKNFIHALPGAHIPFEPNEIRCSCSWLAKHRCPRANGDSAFFSLTLLKGCSPAASEFAKCTAWASAANNNPGAIPLNARLRDARELLAAHDSRRMPQRWRLYARAKHSAGVAPFSCRDRWTAARAHREVTFLALVERTPRRT